MLKDEFYNKFANNIKAFKEQNEQIEKGFNAELSKVSDPRQKAILINAMKEVKQGKMPNIKVILNKLNAK